MRDLCEMRLCLDGACRRKGEAARRVREEETGLEEARREAAGIITAQAHLQEIAAAVQRGPHKQIARVVSRCLSAVFEEPYELRIELERRRGKTEVEFVYLRRGRKVSPRLTSGGVLGVASLALRLASLTVSLPPARKFLALDEPFQGLDKANLARMGVFLEVLARDLGVQLLIVTHDAALQVGRVIEIGP